MKFVFIIGDFDKPFCIEGESKEHVEEILEKAYDKANFKQNEIVRIGDLQIPIWMFEQSDDNFYCYKPPPVYSLEEWFEKVKVKL